MPLRAQVRQLPLYYALKYNAGPEVVAALLQAYPAAASTPDAVRCEGMFVCIVLICASSMHVFIWFQKYVDTYIYTYIKTCIYLYMYIFKDIYIYIHIYVFVYVCIYIYIYTYTCIYIYIQIRILIHIHIHIHMYLFTHTGLFIHVIYYVIHC